MYSVAASFQTKEQSGVPYEQLQGALRRSNSSVSIFRFPHKDGWMIAVVGDFVDSPMQRSIDIYLPASQRIVLSPETLHQLAVRRARGGTEAR
jgi:hypothetical protein